jgi:hypothetical protein
MKYGKPVVNNIEISQVTAQNEAGSPTPFGKTAFIIRRYLGAFVTLICFYTITLAAVFLIPQSMIEKHRLQSIAFMNSEGTYPKALFGTVSLDNYTDNGVMLGLLAPFHTNPIQRAFGIYPRYWNGWSILLRPFLVAGNIQSIRAFQSAIFLGLLIITVTMIAKRANIAFSMIFLVSLLPAHLELVAVSQQFSKVFFIIFAAVIWLTSRRRRPVDLTLALFVIGSVTNFFDMLTTPVLTLIYPIATWLLLNFSSHSKSAHRRQTLPTVIAASASWCIGYALTWVAKWTLSTVITGSDVFSQATNQAALRMNGNLDNTSIQSSPSSAIHQTFIVFSQQRPLSQLVLITFILLLILGLCTTLIHTKKKDLQWMGHSRRNHTETIGDFITQLLVILVWMMALHQHTEQHAFFTYRLYCAVSFILLSAAFTSIIPNTISNRWVGLQRIFGHNETLINPIQEQL